MLVIDSCFPSKKHWAGYAHIPRSNQVSEPEVWKTRQAVCGLYIGSDLNEIKKDQTVCSECIRELKKQAHTLT